MANRIVGNVYILDTVTGDTPIAGGKFNVSSFSFWGSTTDGLCELCVTSSLNVIFKAEVGSPGGEGPLNVYVNTIFDEIRVKTLTAGTAWMYLQ